MSAGSHRIHALRIRLNRLQDRYIPNAVRENNEAMLDFYQGEANALEWVIELLTGPHPATATAVIDALRRARGKDWDGRSITGAANCLKRAGIRWDDFACGVTAALIAMEPPQPDGRALLDAALAPVQPTCSRCGRVAGDHFGHLMNIKPAVGCDCPLTVSDVLADDRGSK